jgi:myosin heavy subunit
MDSESLWLQNSINLADPFDTHSDRSVAESDKSSSSLSTKDLDLVGKAPEPLVASRAAPIRSTTQFRSSVRMSSLCNPMLFPSSGEIDEMKSKIVQLQREKLKWEDTSRDLERSKAELAQTKEDYKVLEEYSKKIKTTADESTIRADRDAKARQEAEAKLVETVLNATRDVQQLKQQMDEAEKNFSHSMFELKEEHNTQLAKYSEENAIVVSELKDANESLQQELTTKDQQWQLSAKQIRDLEVQVDETEEKRSKLQQQLKETQQTMEELLKQERSDSEMKLREMQSKMEALKDQKEVEIAELRQEHAKQTKALTAKLEELEKKFEKTRDDFFSARSQIQDKADQLQRLHTEKELELKKLSDSHRSTVLEQKIQFEEELQASRSQFRAVTEELGEAKKLKTKLEGELGIARSQLGEKDRELTSLRRDLSNTQERLDSAIAEVHNVNSQLEQTDDLINRLANDRDTTQRGMEEDLAEAREKTKRTEDEVLQLQKELSAQRREFMKADVEYRRVNEELATKLSMLQQRSGSEHSERMMQLLKEKKLAEESVAQMTSTIAELQKKLHRANEDSLQEMTRREAAEKLLQDHMASRRSKAMRNVSLSPMPATVLTEVPNNRRLSSEPPLKRARSESMRTFAITGFKTDETQQIRDQILTMPSTNVVGASNLPTPMEVTHLISREVLTVKLLTAAARGCWILPPQYVTDSCAAGYWLDEQKYGFQHKMLPFQNKKVAFTNLFKHEKQHFSAAKSICEAGGAMIVDELSQCDFLIESQEENNQGTTLTWDSLVHLAYPKSS